MPNYCTCKDSLNRHLIEVDYRLVCSSCLKREPTKRESNYEAWLIGTASESRRLDNAGERGNE